MKIDRDTYLKPFEKESFFLKLKCILCESGLLEICKDTFQSKSTNTSSGIADSINDFEALDFKFITFLKCKHCTEISIAAGTGYLKEDQWPSFAEDSIDFGPELKCHYSIKYIDPPINIIDIPKEVPDGIKDMLVSSFSLFWHDVSSAGNKIRKAIELILHEKNIDSKTINKKGEDVFLSLHARIEKFGSIENQKYKDLADMLIGIKWLGNESSHKDESPEKEDLLDAYDILTCIFDEIFVREVRKLDAKDKADKLTNKFKQD